MGRTGKTDQLSKGAAMVEVAKSYHNIIVEIEGRIATITMNRPEKRNALSIEHMQELTRCLEEIGKSQDASVVILKANGPAFSAGHDLNELIDRSPDVYEQVFAVCTELMETVQSIPQPVIAQVSGVATAAGCQLVATCDLAVADEEARFATPGVKIGLFCSTPMVALSRAVGRKKAMEMLLTGDFISAQEALAAGLVNQVVRAADLDAATRRLAEKIVAASPLIVGIGKQAFYRQIEMTVHEAYAYASDVMASNAALGDAQEGMGAFLEKRTPQWKGR